jgi:hypothetical protein
MNLTLQRNIFRTLLHKCDGNNRLEVQHFETLVLRSTAYKMSNYRHVHKHKSELNFQFLEMFVWYCEISGKCVMSGWSSKYTGNLCMLQGLTKIYFHG